MKGWDGGITWINTASLQRRYDYAGWVVNGTRGVQALAGFDLGRMAVQSGLVDLTMPDVESAEPDASASKKAFAKKRRAAALQARELFALPPVPLENMVSAEDRKDAARLVSVLAGRLLPGEAVPGELLGRFRKAASGQPPLTDAAIRRTLLAMVQSPVYQLG